MTLITEQEFYDTCNLWLAEISHRNNNPVKEDEKHTFILITVQESAETIGHTISLIDPGVPSENTQEGFCKATQGQQSALMSIPPIKKALQKTTEKIIEMHQIAHQCNVTISQAISIFMESENADDFIKKLRATSS